MQIIAKINSKRIHNYKEKDFNENNGYTKYNSIICSVESLHYIPDDKQFDFIIIDECESIFKQFSSTTTRQSEKSYHVLYNLVKISNKIFLRDCKSGFRQIPSSSLQKLNTIITIVLPIRSTSTSLPVIGLNLTLIPNFFIFAAIKWSKIS